MDTSTATSITSALSGFLPQMAIVGAAAVGVGAGILLWQRAWKFFKGLSK